MKLINKFIFVFYLLLSLALLGYVFKQPGLTDTSVFCAYGHLFVEFEEGWHKWGTMLLDRNGRPISCDEGKFGITGREQREKEHYDKSI